MNEPLTIEEMERSLKVLWERCGPGRSSNGLAVMGPEWRGHLWLMDDGVFRGELRHHERGIFSASKTGDDPIVIEGWNDSRQVGRDQ